MKKEAEFARGDGVLDPVSATALSELGAMVAMAVVDPEGVITYASDRWCEITGWFREEVVGSHWDQIVHPDDLAAARKAGRMAMEDGSLLRYESRVVSKSGSKTTWIQSNVAPMTAPDGSTAGWLLVAYDLTDHMMAAEALVQSERRLQVIFDSSTDAITILEPDGTWRSNTSSMRKLLGHGPDFVPNEAWQSIHPDDLHGVRQAFWDLVEGNENVSGLYEYRVVTADETVKWVETAGVNLVDDPAVGGIVLHTRDVTERHKAAEELRSMASRLNSVVSSLPVGVMLADETGRPAFANRAATELLGLRGDPEEILRRGPRAIRAEMREKYADYNAHAKRVTAIVEAREPVTAEKVEFVDGRTLARSYTPIFDGDTYRGHLWIFEDLSDQVAVEAAREYLLEIEKRQNARLIELDMLKTDLVASVSHELRTPLTSIVSFTRLLRDGLGRDTLEDQAEFLGVIVRNTERLLGLVDDLLWLDRMESNTAQLNFEAVEMPALVELAVSSIHATADEKGVTLHWELTPGPRLMGDVGRLGQLIDNLLANAVKFTPRGGSASVEARPIDGGWRLEVTDTGIGIPVDELDQLFHRFFRASNARRQAISGSGLGLAIARRVAELHRGTVEISSTEGSGTTVVVTLLGADDPLVPVSPLAGLA